MAEIFVDLQPPEQWKAITRENCRRGWKMPSTRFPARARSRNRFETTFSKAFRTDGQIVKVFGDDAATLRQKANEVRHAVSGVRAFRGRSSTAPAKCHSCRLKSTADARPYGLNVADVQDVVETALGGKVATEIWEGDRRYGVAVRLRESDRRNTAAIGEVLVDTPSGARVPLADVANISVRGGSMNISREGGLRVSAIGVFIRGRDMGGVVAEMRDKVEHGVTFPPGYYTTFGGEFENQQRAMARLAVIVPVSVFLIFILLFNAFGSVKSASVILANIPLASIGGIVALYLTGIHLSVSAAIGFIALFGQAVLNGVVMVSYFADLRAQGLSPREAVTKGATLRLRTVLMTALLAMLGLMPMALSHGIGSEVQKPLAVVVIGGLVSATLLTLLVLPTLYLLVEER